VTLPEATHKIIDNMRGTPALMAVIVLQLATLAMVYFVADANADRVHEREMALIAACEAKERT
jgi:acetolactate synthase small subunit